MLPLSRPLTLIVENVGFGWSFIKKKKISLNLRVTKKKQLIKYANFYQILTSAHLGYTVMQAQEKQQV